LLSAFAVKYSADCDSVALKKEIKELLKPDYNYDSSKITHITFKNKKQLKEIEIPLFIGERYKFIFNTKALPQDVSIKIYNKKIGSKKRTLLFSNEKYLQNGEKVYAWEPEKARRLYLDYEIPVTNDTIKKGCSVFMIGYKLK
jgi:hypothetical protein